jgi:hypothetical protein
VTIFVSWSGPRSLRIAEIVCRWLRTEVPGVDPWLSSQMEKGTTWSSTLLDGLARSTTGILCVTAEAEHDWMAFEAGALLAGTARDDGLFVLLVDPDPVALAGSPLGRLPGFAVDHAGIRALILGLGLPRTPPDDAVDELVRALAGVGTAHVRDFELVLVLPEGTVRRPFSPLRDSEWLPAIEGVVDVLRREDGLAIAEHDFTRFRYLDMRSEKWIALPKRLASIATDQLAVVDPGYAEAWYENATIATQMLQTGHRVQLAMDARDERTTFDPASAFLYGYYCLQMQNRHLGQPAVAGVLAEIQRLEGIPPSWRFEVAARFLATADMNELQKALGRAPGAVQRLVSFGFSFSSVVDAVTQLDLTASRDFFERLVRQFQREMAEIGPPESVAGPVREALDRVLREPPDDMAAWLGAFRDGVTGFISWLQQPAV